jgi:MATE family multidrug resistance protein
MPLLRRIPTRAEVRELLQLAVPVVVVQVGMMFMGVVDTLMVGRVSAAALAGVALGNLFFFGVVIFGLGALMALDPLIAQAVGAHDDPAIARALQRAVALMLVLSLPASVLLWPAEAILAALGQPADAVPLAGRYARIIIPSVLPFMAFTVLRQALQAMGRMRAIVLTILFANIANALLNWVLIFGHFGAPAMGVAGAAWATTVSRWLMALVLLALGWRDLRPYLLAWRPDSLQLRPLGRMLRLGLPIGLQFQLEYTAFGLTGLLMGLLGTSQVAAHQVAINLASLTYMVPLGVSAAAAVLVGQAVGRDDQDGARRAARTAVFVGAAFMVGTGAVFLSAPGWLARLYTTSVPVLAVATALLPLAGLFQVFDGVQVVAGGILRGLGDTRSPMIINLLGFWGVGIPAGLALGFPAGLGAVGLWWGLVAGLASVATILFLRVRHRFKTRIDRVTIDERPHRV